MGLSSALATAMSGLRANQAALSIVSSNVANAQTPGYVTQSVNQIELPTGGAGLAASRSPASIASSICTSRASCARKPPAAPMPTRCPISWASCKASTARPAARARWKPRSAISPPRCRRYRPVRAASPRRSSALSAAQTLAQQLNSTTQGIQSLRTNVEQDIGTSRQPGQCRHDRRSPPSTPSCRD